MFVHGASAVRMEFTDFMGKKEGIQDSDFLLPSTFI